MEGWTPLYRDIINQWIFHDAYALKVWIYIKSKVSYCEYNANCKGELVYLDKHQLIYGRPEWSERLNIPEGKLRGIMDSFINLRTLTVKPVGRRYSIITLLDSELYHRDDIQEKEPNRITNAETFNNQALDIINNQQNNQQITNRKPNKKNKDNKDNINNNKILSSKAFADDSVSYQLALKLKNLILKNNEKAKVPDEKGFQKWAADFDKLIRIDNKQEEEIEKVIEFSQSNTFWQCNILSAGKLREKYDTLLLQSRNQGKPAAYQSNQGKLPINMTNFKQREYSDDFYENLYENK